MARVTLCMTEEEHRLLKTISLVNRKSMSQIISEFIKKTARKLDLSSLIPGKSEEISELGKRLLAMPIEEGDDFDKEMMKETAKTREEPSIGSLKDLQKELGLKQHAS